MHARIPHDPLPPSYPQMAARDSGSGALEAYMHSGKLLALDLLVAVLSNPLHDWDHLRPEFAAELRHPLCLALLRNCMSQHDQVRGRVCAVCCVLCALHAVPAVRLYACLSLCCVCICACGCVGVCGGLVLGGLGEAWGSWVRGCVEARPS